ncbi:TVP38/TMEM64 family protein [Streptomyces fenghuangensis]|uniref:TVP38/TMEM64 family membrane protein n=1 Tax=Streptomyces chitinivorans TaxID=1257027 RepID=A0ABW7HXK8_9ACTN|nr:VTT domain-containing protein [Streptomyces chitinivorans]MDH2409988.1 VTT domain-containing protein [Streptomyces chitinivorans]
MPVPAPRPVGPAARWSAVLFSPWSRLSLLAVLLAAAATTVALHEPQQLIAQGWRPPLTGGGALALFALAYGLGTAALVPRPVLNLASGALFGAALGTAAAVAGTVLGAGLAFGLGRLLGQDALRPLLRGRWLAAGDRQLSRRGFRSMLVLRVLPGIPFAVSNYGASVSRMRWSAFLSATALGCVPNTAAYAVAGSQASTPTSPVFLVASAFIAVPGLAAAVFAWRRRARLRGSGASASASASDQTTDQAADQATDQAATGAPGRAVTGPVRANPRRSPAVSLSVPDRP